MKAILFDLDGTLIDSVGDIAAAANHALSALGREPLDVDRIRGHVGDGARTLLARCLAPDDRELDRALDAFLRYYADHPHTYSRPYDGIVALLSELEPHRLGVLSNKPELLCRKALEGLSMAEHFQTIVGGDTCAERKPSAEPLRYALEQLSVSSEDALVVGDGPQDIGVGRAMNVPTIAVTWGFHHRERLVDQAPTFIADSVPELRALLSNTITRSQP